MRASKDYARQIDPLLRQANPDLDFGGPEYQTAVGVFARLLLNNSGSLVRDDINFTVGFYNDCRHITRGIDALRVPAPFKRVLREHYARVMIEQGEAKDYEVETRWLASLPPGKLVVQGVPGAAREPDVIYTDQSDLAAMVVAAVPEFGDLDASQKAALLEVICTLNPAVECRVIRTGGEKVDGVRENTIETITYQVGRGRPVLVPSMEYLKGRTGITEKTVKTRR